MDFLKYRYFFLVLSLVIIISGITYGLVTGYKFDIDFKGGTRIQADLKQEYTNKQVEDIVTPIIGSKPLVQSLSGGVSSVSITTNVIPEETTTKITDALKQQFPNMDEPSIRNVQPSFGKNLIDSAVLAITFSIVILLIYIGVRFRTLGFTSAISAIASLIHDILIMLAIYGFFKLPINSTFVAVLLTTIGYSINDTIIVYDRIRENKRKVTRNTDLKDTINGSVNQTMRRTLFTSLTTITAISIVLVFAILNGQEVLQEFAIPLTIGIVSGTYSSIFIAAALWYIFDGIKNRKNKVAKASK